MTVQIYKNTIYQCGQQGIYVNNGKADIRGNIIEQNRKQGILVENRGEVLVYGFGHFDESKKQICSDLEVF